MVPVTEREQPRHTQLTILELGNIRPFISDDLVIKVA